VTADPRPGAEQTVVVPVWDGSVRWLDECVGSITAQADARRRLRRHPDVPLWAKALLPIVRRYHDRRIEAALAGVEERRVLSDAGAA
jgi:hypothetical protein